MQKNENKKKNGPFLVRCVNKYVLQIPKPLFQIENTIHYISFCIYNVEYMPITITMNL